MTGVLRTWQRRIRALQGWNRSLDLLALLAGAALPLAFSPFELRPLAVLSPAMLFVILSLTTRRRAFWRGWLYGLGMFGTGVYWLYFSFHLFGDAVKPLAGLMTAGFVAGMALYPAGLAYLLVRFGRLDTSLGLLFVAPGAWVLFEWLRGWFLGGFPWLLLGYSQIDGPVRGFAALGGVYSVSWVVALTAGLVAVAVCGRWRWGPTIGLAMLWPLGVALGQVHWTHPTGEPLRVALVQGNIPQDRKFQPETVIAAIKDYMNTTRELRDVDLVLWPETAIPTFYSRVESMLQPLVREMGERGADVASGVFFAAGPGEYYNSVVKLGAPAEVYHKRHLVPFGEYLPLRSVLAVLERWIAIPMSDISSGPEDPAPLHLAGQRIAVSICYEDAFGRLLIDGARQSGLMLNVSNDSWFGDSSAPHQHLEIARMRSLETGRSLLRATNTGVSAIIDPRGWLMVVTPQFTRGVARAEVPVMQGVTPYMRGGDWPLVLLVLLSMAVAVRLTIFAGREPESVE